MRSKFAAGLLAGIYLLTMAPIASARPSGAALDDAPPPVHLLSGDARQEGHLRNSRWTTQDPPFCLETITRWQRGFYPMWPDEMAIDGREITIRVSKLEPATEVSLHYWRRVTNDFGGKPLGKRRSIPIAFEPVVTAEGPRWDGSAHLPARGRTFYLSFHGEWMDTEACFLKQRAEWLFAVKVR
jgi:hypothetical protein